jgi:hypothetical protein
MQKVNCYYGKIRGYLRSLIVGDSLSDSRAKLPARFDHEYVSRRRASDCGTELVRLQRPLITFLHQRA